MAVITTEEIRLVVSGDKAALASLKAFSDVQGEVGKSSRRAGASLEEMEAALGGSKNAAKKATEQAKAYREAIAQQARATRNNRDALAEQAKAAEYTRDALGRLRDPQGRFVGGAKDATRAVGGLNKGLKKLVGSITAVISVSAALSQFRQGVQFASEFERGVANVNTLLSEGSVSAERYRGQLRDLAKGSSKDLLDLTRGLYQTISAGIPAIEGAAGAFEVLKQAQKAAVAGLATTEEAVNATVTVLNAYGRETISAKEANEKLLRTVNLGRTNYSQLALSLGTVATTSASFGLSVEELLASVSTLTRSGFSTEEAMTSIQGAILGIASPAQNVSKLAKKLGLDFSAAGIKANGFAGTLQAMMDATGGNADAMAALFPNVRGLRAAVILAGAGAEGFAKDMQSLADATGATDEAHEKIAKTFSETAAIFKSNLQDTYIAAVERTMPRLQKVLEDVGAYLVENQDAIGRSVDNFVAGVISVGEFIAQHGNSMIRFVKVFFAVSAISKATAAIGLFKDNLTKLGVIGTTAGASVGDGIADGISSKRGRISGALSAALRSPGLLTLGVSLGVELGTAIGTAIGEHVHSAWRVQIAAVEAETVVAAGRLRDRLEALGFKSMREFKSNDEMLDSGRYLLLEGRAVEINEAARQGSGVLTRGLQDAQARFDRQMDVQRAEIEVALKESAALQARAEQVKAKLSEAQGSLTAARQAQGRGGSFREGMVASSSQQQVEVKKLRDRYAELTGEIEDYTEIATKSEARIRELGDKRLEMMGRVSEAQDRLRTKEELKAAELALKRKQAREQAKAEAEKDAKAAEKRAQKAAQEARAMIAAFKAGVGAAGLPTQISTEARMAFGREIERRAMGLPTEAEQQARWRLEAEAVNAQIAAQQQARAQQLQQAQGVGLIGGGLLLEGGTIDAQGTQQLDEFKRTMEAATDTSIMAAQTIEGAFRGMADSLGEAVAVAIIHGERLDRVFKKGAASMIESLSIQAFQQAAYLIAALPAASILFPGVGTGAVLTAAGSLAAFGVGAAGIAALLGGGSGDGGRGRRRGGVGGGYGGPAPRAASTPEPNQGQGNTTIVLRLGVSRSWTHDMVVDEANSRLGQGGRPRIVVA